MADNLVKQYEKVIVGNPNATDKKLNVEGELLITDKIYIGDTNTYLSKDGSDNLVLTDANAGDKTVADAGTAPTDIYQLYQPDGTNPFVYTDNSGNLHIDGDIIQSGASYTTSTEQVLTTNDLIVTRNGAVAGLGAGEYTGFQAKLYDGTNDGMLVFDNAGIARVGDVGSLQAIATREDSPTDGGYAKWNNTAQRFDTVNESYLLDSGDTSTGTYTLGTVHAGLSEIMSSGAVLQVNGFMRTGSIYLHEGGGSPTTNALVLDNSSGTLTWNGNTVWTSANDGIGSGLDADYVDGLQATSFIRSDADDLVSGNITFTNSSFGVADSNMSRIAHPDGATYSGPDGAVGAIKITLPVSWTNTMMQFEVDLYDYATNESIKLRLGGYNYSATTDWHNPFAQVITSNSSKFFTVRFGHDGSNCVIYVGELASSWAYPQVSVSNFVAGYNGISISSWIDGWSIGLEASAFGTITQTLTANNYASYALNANLLDNINSSQFLRNDQATQTIDGGTSTTVNIACDDAGEAVINLLGTNQGTGRVFVGQSSDYGGGIEYNGDNTPASSGAGADYVTLYRRTAGTTYWTARNLHINNNWEFRDVVTASRFISNVASGTAPLSVTSTTVVSNLNVDMVDGYHASAYNVFTGNALVTRHSSGYIYTNYINTTANTTTNTATRIAVQEGDSFLRWQTPAQFFSNHNFDADTLDGQHGSYYNHKSYNVDNYLGGNYTSGGNEKPNTFGSGKLKIRMLSGTNIGNSSTWNDVLWMSTYTGGDVKVSGALVIGKSTEAIGFMRQNYDSTSWGTYREIYHTGSFTVSESSTVSTVVKRNSSGDINARLFRSEYDSTNATIGFIMTQIDTASNNYIRPSTPTQFRSAVIDGYYVKYNASGTTVNSFGSSSITFSYVDANNIDHFWYNDTDNSYNFCADTTYKATANALVKAATFYEGGSTLSSKYLRKNTSDTFTGSTLYMRGDIVVEGTYRDHGVFGTYDSTKTQHIWSMGIAYRNNSAGTNFGNLYGLAYKHTNNTTGGTMASGHQMVWCQNGTGYAAMGTNIWTSGVVAAANHTINSDIRFKENLETITGGLDKVMQLNPTYFSWNELSKKHKRFTDRKDFGYISQEVEKVIPEAVDVDDDGYQVLSYMKMPAINTAAIQDLYKQTQDENTKLKSELDELKSQLSDITKILEENGIK